LFVAYLVLNIFRSIAAVGTATTATTATAAAFVRTLTTFVLLLSVITFLCFVARLRIILIGLLFISLGVPATGFSALLVSLFSCSLLAFIATLSLRIAALAVALTTASATVRPFARLFASGRFLLLTFV
jgi:hypothetical protein